MRPRVRRNGFASALSIGERVYSFSRDQVFQTSCQGWCRPSYSNPGRPAANLRNLMVALVDKISMPIRTSWIRVPLLSINQTTFGRPIRAYRHPDGDVLLHLKIGSRSSVMYHRAGSWVLYRGDQKLGVVTYYNQRTILCPPIKWANERRRRYDAKEALGTPRTKPVMTLTNG